MTADAYLQGLLQSYAVNTTGAKAAGNQIYPTIQKWGGTYLLAAEFSGSIAKGTGVSLSTDADIFLSVSSSTPGTLANMYDTLCQAISDSGLPIRRQDVSVGTTVNGYSIDLVPGKRQSQFGNEHSLYRNSTGTWTKTDVQRHINLVANSSRTNEIRLLKLWRIRNNVRFPSFYLELAVLDALHYARTDALAANLYEVLQHLRDEIQTARYVDPANTNNIVSDDCTAAEKSAIATMAAISLGKRTWQEIVW